MGKLIKRGKIWYTNFTAPDGTRIRKSTGTTNKRYAQEYQDYLKVEYWRRFKLGEPVRKTWEEAVLRWTEERENKKTFDGDLKMLEWWDRYLDGKYLDEIDRDTVEAGARIKIAEGVTHATVNRYVAVVSSVLNTALKEWAWLKSVPKLRIRKEESNRVRFLTKEEFEELRKELPPHLENMACFAVFTGLRESNITNLKWSQVDLQNGQAWIHANESKSGNALNVPLNPAAMKLIKKQIGIHKKYVFTYKGRPVTRCNNHAWRKALKRAGIDNFRWHDLRHTWATWLVQEGVPLAAIQKLGGWSTFTMVQRYAHFTDEHLRQYVDAYSPTCDDLLSFDTK